MYGNSDRNLWSIKRLLCLLLLVVGCTFLCGCPLIPYGRSYSMIGSFNRLYFGRCKQLGSSEKVKPERLIRAYYCLLYMDAEVAGGAYKDNAKIPPDFRLESYSGVDQFIAFQALQELIPLYILQKDWPELLRVLKKHKLFLKMAYNYDQVEAVLAALEQAKEHGQDIEDIREVAYVLTAQLESISRQDPTRNQAILDRLRRLTNSIK